MYCIYITIIHKKTHKIYKDKLKVNCVKFSFNFNKMFSDII